MAKNVLNTILKICTFIMIMWLVSFIPYENIIDPLIFENVNYNTAKTLIFYILGETYSEPYDLLLLYLYILLNIIISIPLLSLVTISTSIYTNNTKHHSCAKEWLASVVRRYMKTFIYSTIFCSSFRLIPYEQIVSNVDKEIILLLIIIFNLVFSTILYFSLVEIVKRTRSS